MQRLRSLALNPDGFAFDPTTGESFTLNATGLAVVEALREGLTAEQLTARLVERFEVSPLDASRDLDDFLDHLRSFRLL
ncbi:MAG TPA: HPr-rel-A system PqqD family peptide chaperone [Longimicrobiales bacterium]|nr:HPr-rel-A system PqqD family peptide chaperone [Longimicrobiales bacterium]